jgi:hypothetical protein
MRVDQAEENRLAADAFSWFRKRPAPGKAGSDLISLR